MTKKKRKKRIIKSDIRADVYVLFAAISNLVSAIEEVKASDDPEPVPEEITFIFRELQRKLGMWYMNQTLREDYDRDIQKIVSGMTGYSSTNPMTVALSLLIHYQEYGNKTIHLTHEFWKSVNAMDLRIHDVEKKQLSEHAQDVVHKSINAGDIMARKTYEYVAHNY